MVRLPGSEVCLNGEWVPREKAMVSVFDRGFIFGDGVYEVVPAYGCRPFLAERHVARLGRSLEAVGIADPLGPDRWLGLIGETAARQDFATQRIYLQVTRGVAPRAHRFPDGAAPTYLLFADELVVPDSAPESGELAVTMEDFRWMRGDIKSVSLMAAVLASERAAQAGATETIFIRDGLVTEGASSNVLCVVGGELASPVVDSRILHGITMTYAEEVAEGAGHPVARRDVTEKELRGASEVMVSSSGKEIVPVTSLDGEAVGDGRPGPVFAALWQRYREGVAGNGSP